MIVLVVQNKRREKKRHLSAQDDDEDDRHHIIRTRCMGFISIHVFEENAGAYLWFNNYFFLFFVCGGGIIK